MRENVHGCYVNAQERQCSYGSIFRLPSGERRIISSKGWLPVLNRNLLLGWLCLSLIPFDASGNATAADSASRPNFVVILCDDLGYGDLSCFGHPHIETPNLDRLAKQGIRLTSCYSSAPVCSSSRAGLLTGRTPSRVGVYDWIPNNHVVHLRSSEVTVATLLKNAGYDTAHVGKWHCNGKFNSDEQPQPGDHGFNHWYSTQNNAAPSHENPSNFVRNGQEVGPQEGFSCQLVASEAIDWLKTKRDAKRPFFLFTCFHEPHEPVASPRELVDSYKDVAENDDQAQYFANVHNVDLAVGRVVAALDDLEIRDNTLVVFSSDNGPETLNRYRSANRSWGRTDPLRGMKLHTHDAGFRVAGIINWPHRVKPNQTVSTPVSSLDFLPTFCRLADAALPNDRKLDGADFLPALDGQPVERDQPLVWAYFNGLNEARVAMRDGRWKVLAKLTDADGDAVSRFQNITTDTLPVVRDARLTEFEIYDIQSDVGETSNLNESRPKLAASLRSKLETKYRELVSNSHVWNAEK